MKTNEKYGAKGWIGRDPGSAPEPFRDPDGLQYSPGYGADEEDLERGWIVPLIQQQPAYDIENYKFRMSEPSVSDATKSNELTMPADIEFRNQKRVSTGFLTRPRPVTRRVFGDERN